MRSLVQLQPRPPPKFGSFVCSDAGKAGAKQARSLTIEYEKGNKNKKHRRDESSEGSPKEAFRERQPDWAGP
jgi:hypothetical protein